MLYGVIVQLKKHITININNRARRNSSTSRLRSCFAFAILLQFRYALLSIFKTLNHTCFVTSATTHTRLVYICTTFCAFILWVFGWAIPIHNILFLVYHYGNVLQLHQLTKVLFYMVWCFFLLRIYLLNFSYLFFYFVKYCVF